MAIPAGFLIAAVAWLRAGSEGSGFASVLVLTYTIALGDFVHVIAGSAEIFLLLFSGKIVPSVAAATIGLSLLGNVIGGTGLFALLAHAQVRQEI
jgi:formate-nitrite transporter family protein